MGTAIDQVLFTPLRRIRTRGGDVLHGMKENDPGYAGFGEVYFSFIAPGEIKGWKRHRRMTLNLLVPTGAVRFVLYDGEIGAEHQGCFHTQTICSETHYGRLTVPPGIWLAFQGLGASVSLVTNVADMPHDPAEVDRVKLGDLEFQWA